MDSGETKYIATQISQMLQCGVDVDLPLRTLVPEEYFDLDKVDFYVSDMRLCIFTSYVSRVLLDDLYSSGYYCLQCPYDFNILEQVQEFMTTVWWSTNDDMGSFYEPQKFGDVGHDLAVTEDYSLFPKSHRMLSTDVKIQLPPNLYGWITPRSSVARRLLLIANGIIDAGYRGELAVPVFNMTNKPIHIEKGERVAQIIFQSRIPITVVKTNVFTYPSDRQADGFGSTGKR